MLSDFQDISAILARLQCRTRLAAIYMHVPLHAIDPDRYSARVLEGGEASFHACPHGG